MRICFIALGEFVHVDAYLEYFASRGHEVSLVTLAPGPERTVATWDVSIPGAWAKLLGKFSYLPAMWRARKLVRRLQPDVVHAHYATSAGLAARAVNVHPWLVTAHGTDVSMGVRSHLWRRLLRNIFTHADYVNPVSEELRDMVLGLGTPVEKVQTFCFGIDTRHFKFTPRTSGALKQPLRLVCTRRFEAVYDHATILRSMAHLKQQGVDCNLTLIGDGILSKGLQRLASELGVTDRVRFAGMVPNKDLPAHLKEYDVYVSASFRDGTSLCLLEAMACGLYPVVSDIKANAEWIRHEANGLMHRVAAPQDLARCICSLLESKCDIDGTLRFNRELVVRKGDRVTNMERLEELYTKLMQTRECNTAGKTGPSRDAPRDASLRASSTAAH